ncbi:hypothetical protein IQR32_00070 [Acinetobacter albensis]|uniref:hypothetical protein n=1 Tax=Acinetobacter albensis TaxID=1673609 RepID=UPI001882FD1F|nr:hypothetical protein [Acinetobacter albensis]MBE9399770.1 hypothetical protein [Acinetobacter albensis]
MLNNQVFRTVRLPVGGEMHKQAGFASILLILFIGLALTTLVIGMVTSVRGLQGSSLTTHAQTQAQIKSAIGYQALSEFLGPLSAAQIATINNGTINGADTVATYTAVTTDCPAEAGGTKYFCYDIKAVSGGASSIVRATYASKTTGAGSFTGSIFAGGLRKDGSATLGGDQTIAVKGDKVVDNQNDAIPESALGGLTLDVFDPNVTFLKAEDLTADANYIFYKNGTCARNNLANISYIEGGVTKYKDITSQEPVACNDISSGISGGTGNWNISGSQTLPVGVLWFEGNVNITLSSAKAFVNTIIATGNIAVNLPNPTGNTDYFSYAPNHYYLLNPNNNRLTRVCGLNNSLVSLEPRPTQYCNADGTLKDMTTSPANIANILFLSNGYLSLDSAGGRNGAEVNYYGNMLSGSLAGGTGNSSGDFRGGGTVNVYGNLVVTGAVQTSLLGNLNLQLKRGTSGGNTVPSKKVMILSGLRYM